MNLSYIGIIASILWYEIKNHAKNIALDEFIDLDIVATVETRHALSLHVQTLIITFINVNPGIKKSVVKILNVY